jgi:hypothetical protein
MVNQLAYTDGELMASKWFWFLYIIKSHDNRFDEEFYPVKKKVQNCRKKKVYIFASGFLQNN